MRSTGRRRDDEVGGLRRSLWRAILTIGEVALVGGLATLSVVGRGTASWWSVVAVVLAVVLADHHADRMYQWRTVLSEQEYEKRVVVNGETVGVTLSRLPRSELERTNVYVLSLAMCSLNWLLLVWALIQLAVR